MEIITKEFNNFDVRILIIDGKEWFIAKDIARLLEYKRTRDAVSQHCKNAVAVGEFKGGDILPPLDPQTKLIQEPDVWRLIIKSKMPEAEKIEKWIMEKVLPSIRKTGSYSIQNSQPPKTQEDPIEKRVQLIQQSEKLFISFEKMFQKIGITEKTELAITTNRAVKNETTVDFIALSGKNGLEVSEKYYTVTELCNLIRESNDYSDETKKLVSTKNLAKAQPRNLNLFLEKNGFQTKELNQWKATQKGEEFSKFVQNKSSTSSKNIYHLNWKIDVLKEVF